MDEWGHSGRGMRPTNLPRLFCGWLMEGRVFLKGKKGGSAAERALLLKLLFLSAEKVESKEGEPGREREKKCLVNWWDSFAGKTCVLVLGF